MATRASSNQQHYEYPDWQPAYHVAVLEIDRDKLLQRVEAAENAIAKRLLEISEGSDHQRERDAIFDAEGTLGFLKLNAKKP